MTLNNITDWLKAINMDQYLTQFLERGLTSVKQILNLTSAGLEDLGIKVTEHKEIVLKAIEEAKQKTQTNFSQCVL